MQNIIALRYMFASGYLMQWIETVSVCTLLTLLYCPSAALSWNSVKINA